MKSQFLTSVLKPSNEPTGSIFIDDMDAAKKVEDLLNKKRSIDKQIDTIQSACNHKNKVIRMIHIGSMHSVRWVCEDCSKVLGWPTASESDKFLGKKA
jgi:hypothetical protein